MSMELTDWIPCSTPPVRTGWYHVERRLNNGRPVFRAERVFFEKKKNGGWDRESCTSNLAIWVSTDYWRGIKQSKESA